MVKPSRLPAYGGQALMEGVLMRGKYAVAAAMRAPDGNIVVHQEALQGVYKSPIMKLPFIRGAIGIWDALGLGMRFLVMSANLQGKEEEKIEGGSIALTVGFSLLLAVALFFAAPAALAHWIESWLKLPTLAGSLVEGVIRLLAVIGYIWAVGFMPEIGRVFAYHGAEHKTINAFEAGIDLTPDAVLKQSLEHPRCGTAFLLTLVVFSIIAFALIGPLPIGLRLLTRVLLIPVLAGIAYEYIRWTADHLDWPLVRALVLPNLTLQKLTTREPDAGMVEVAITSFNAMRELEEKLTPARLETTPLVAQPPL